VAEVHPIPTDATFQDLTKHEPFGLWTVVSFAGQKPRRHRFWNCICACGKEVALDEYSLTSGNSSGCRDCRVKKHGMADTPENRTYNAMMDRCYDEKCKSHHNYGGRGIIVCQRWRESFLDFFADMGERPSLEHSIDRINNDGNYSCGKCEECLANGWIANCRWATQKVQCNNRRGNRLITCDGVTKTMMEWSEISGISDKTIWYRLKIGLDPKIAIFASIGEQPSFRERKPRRAITIDGVTKSMTAWANERGLKRLTIAMRIERGWSERDAVMLPLGSRPENETI